MVISNKPLKYRTDDRDGNDKHGIVLIKVEEYTRDLNARNYRITVIDYVEGQAIARKDLNKSYAEIDGLRAILLSSGKDYSSFKGTALEDELLSDAMLMIIKQSGHYHSNPSDWIKYIEPVVVEPEVSEPPVN